MEKLVGEEAMMMMPEHWSSWVALGFLAMGLVVVLYAMFTDKFNDIGR